MKNTLITARYLQSQVKQALAEDIGQHDLTADLIPEHTLAQATLITREPAILCGQAWCNEVFRQLDPHIHIEWAAADGERLQSNDLICTLQGPARTLLTGERTAMNFLQTLSATATLTHRYVEQVSGLPVAILDTRKTIPTLRLAQKYAVLCGGGRNHRIGLYDGILIKENHINAAGSIRLAVSQARTRYPEIPVEVEVENLEELAQALEVQADMILLDNFSITDLQAAVSLNQGRSQLEASGNVNLRTVRQIAETGVDRISIGALTKDIKAIDLSMRFQ